MKAIKALVAFMGVLLIAGMGLLGYGFYNKAGQKSRAAAVPAAAAEEFGTVSVPLPAGAKVEEALEAGDRIVLRIVGAGAERYVVLDPDEGRVAGTFVLTPEAPR